MVTTTQGHQATGTNLFARILLFISTFFLIIFISIIIALLLSFPVLSSATVLLDPHICNHLQRNHIDCICGCAGGGGSEGGPPSIAIADATSNHLAIKYEWPHQVDVGSSDYISIVLGALYLGGGLVNPQLTATTVGNRELAAAVPQAVGTEITGGTLKNAFGPSYEVSAVANLLTTTFDVKTFQPTEQSLDASTVSWIWNIKPITPGPQVIDVAIDFLWKPIGRGQLIQHQIWQTQLPVTVTQPYLDKGQLSIGAIVAGMLGPGGLISIAIVGMFTRVILPIFSENKNNETKENKGAENSQKPVDREGQAGQAPTPTQQQKYPPEFKTEVVLNVLRGVMSDAEAWQHYQLDPQLLNLWKPKFLERAPLVFRSEAMRRRKQDR